MRKERKRPIDKRVGMEREGKKSKLSNGGGGKGKGKGKKGGRVSFVSYLQAVRYIEDQYNEGI